MNTETIQQETVAETAVEATEQKVVEPVRWLKVYNSNRRDRRSDERSRWKKPKREKLAPVAKLYPKRRKPARKE